MASSSPSLVCSTLKDEHQRVVFAFEANGHDNRKRPMFIVGTNTKSPAGVPALAYHPETPAKGSVRWAFYADRTAGKTFAVYTNAKLGGRDVFSVPANAVLTDSRRLIPLRQTPLNKRNWPLFIGNTNRSGPDGPVFVAECKEKTESALERVFVARSERKFGDLDLFFLGYPNAVNSRGQQFFVQKCTKRFDGVPAAVLRYNFVRQVGDKRTAFPSRYMTAGKAAHLVDLVAEVFADTSPKKKTAKKAVESVAKKKVSAKKSAPKRVVTAKKAVTPATKRKAAAKAGTASKRATSKR